MRPAWSIRRIQESRKDPANQGWAAAGSAIPKGGQIAERNATVPERPVAAASHGMKHWNESNPLGLRARCGWVFDHSRAPDRRLGVAAGVGVANHARMS